MARKPLSNIADPCLETRSWSPPALLRTPVEPRPPGRGLSQLAKAREVLAVLAKAQRGLVFEDRSTSVALWCHDAPAAEPAIVEAAERLAVGGHLVLHQGPLVVQLSLAQPEWKDDPESPSTWRPEGRPD